MRSADRSGTTHEPAFEHEHEGVGVTSWQLQPEGIESVLTRTSDGRTTLAATFSQSAVDGLGGGLSWSPLCVDVVAALGELVSGGYTDFLATVQTVDAGVAGVYNAAVAYNQAGAEMAGTFEAAAVTAAAEGDFSYFEQNGYAS